MTSIVSNFERIKKLINNNVNIIAVSKSFQYEHIKPLVDYGHKHFGENKVQEAFSKWSKVKEKQSDLSLHMIGKLQSNKAREAVNLFDYIHSLDNIKLATLLSKFENSLKKKKKVFHSSKYWQRKTKKRYFN